MHFLRWGRAQTQNIINSTFEWKKAQLPVREKMKLIAGFLALVQASCPSDSCWNFNSTTNACTLDTGIKLKLVYFPNIIQTYFFDKFFKIRNLINNLQMPAASNSHVNQLVWPLIFPLIFSDPVGTDFGSETSNPQLVVKVSKFPPILEMLDPLTSWQTTYLFKR